MAPPIDRRQFIKGGAAGLLLPPGLAESQMLVVSGGHGPAPSQDAGSSDFLYPGIPQPTYTNATLEARGYVAWPYNPITLATPTLPSPWTTNTANFFYVQAGGTNSSNGYPANPRGTFPSTGSVSAGDVIVVSDAGGNFGAMTVIYNGSTSEPVFIVAASGDSPTFTSASTVGGSHVLLDGLRFSGNGDPIWGVSGGEGGTTYIACRNCYFRDTNTTIGRCVGWASHHTLFYNCEITANEPTWPDTYEDHHGMKGVGDDQWVIDCTFHDLQGDGIQVGDQNNQPGDINRIFIGGCTAYNCYQTGFWAKDSTDCIISSCTAHDNHSSGGGSTPAGIGGQYDVIHLWIINNLVYNCGGGIKIQSTSSGNGSTPYIVGNVCRDGTGAGFDPTNTHSNAGINNRMSLGGYIVLNTVHNYPGGIYVPFHNYIVGNFIDDPTNASAQHIRSSATLDECDYNFYRGSSAKLFGTSAGANSITSTTPGFVNEAGDNFTPDTGSLLRNVIPSASGTVDAVFDAFESRFGFSIREDLLGSARPQETNFSIGAIEP